jgi:TPR repeat protein
MHPFKYSSAVIIFLLSIAVPAAAGPIEDGEAAYQSGNYSVALRLWRPLAERGEAAAQFNLGVMYNNGSGVPKDYASAYMWFSLAAARGDQTAAEYRDAVEKSMSPAQIAEAQRLTREWRPSKGGPSAKQPSSNQQPR